MLLDAGLSLAEVQQMRRQFYESRGEEVPEGMDLGDVSEFAALSWDASNRRKKGFEKGWADFKATNMRGLWRSSGSRGI